MRDLDALEVWRACCRFDVTLEVAFVLELVLATGVGLAKDVRQRRCQVTITNLWGFWL